MNNSGQRQSRAADDQPFSGVRLMRAERSQLPCLAVPVDNHPWPSWKTSPEGVRTVAEHLNFRKAAEHLFLTQPPSRFRSKGSKTISAFASSIAPPIASRLLRKDPSCSLREENSHPRFRSGTRTWREGWKGLREFSLGVSTTIAQYVLPRVLGAFLDEHPRVQFSLHSGNTSEIVQLLLDDKLSVGLIEGPARDRGIRTEPSCRELVLITSPAFEAITCPRSSRASISYARTRFRLSAGRRDGS